MQVIISQPLAPTSIAITTTTQQFNYQKDIQQQVDQLRIEKFAEAQSLGQNIRESTTYCCQDYNYNEDQQTLSLTLCLTKYRNLAMKKFLSTESQLHIQQHQARSLFVTGIIQTSDGYYIFPQRSANILKNTQHKITTIGGTLSPEETKITSFESIIDHMNQECKEELGIQDDSIQTTDFIGMISSKDGNIGLLFLVKLTIDNSTLRQYFDKDSDNEMVSLYTIKQNELQNFLISQGGNLSLYGNILNKTNIIS